MHSSLQSFIKKENLFSPSEKILLTVSGGIDSVMMCELFYKAGFKFAIAHCNFQLRGEESNGDEKFVAALAEKYNAPFHIITFNTSAFAKKNKLSIQIAARQLRYQWFEEIREKFNYKYIATAHHQDDSIETLFINLIRGTGISGLHGILPKLGNIIRPMLFTNKIEIEKYASKNELQFREDRSNASDKYVRNKIRHQVIPVLKELNPVLEKTITDSMRHLRDIELIYKNDIEAKRSEILKQENSTVLISIKQLKKLDPAVTYLYEFLKPFNFNTSSSSEIIAALESESGKQFFSTTHRLIKDRDFLIIEKISGPKNQIPGTNEIQASEKFQIKKSQKELIFNGLRLNFKTDAKPANHLLQTKNTCANLDFDKLKFPLEIRKWQQGDAFYPLGMKGRKKLSDFFIDKKLPISQKENIWLLISGGSIAWVIGQRIDERFKITNKTQKIYFVELV